MENGDRIKVLFLCTGNSARSILAEYLLRSMDPRFETWSAGAEPTGQVHPMALKVLREGFRIDAAGARSKSWEAVKDVDFDVVITVCDHARDVCPLVPSSPAIQAHWGSPDPARESGGPSRVEAAFRRVAGEIHGRLESFCALPFDTREREELARRIRALGGD